MSLKFVCGGGSSPSGDGLWVVEDFVDRGLEVSLAVNNSRLEVIDFNLIPPFVIFSSSATTTMSTACVCVCVRVRACVYVFDFVCFLLFAFVFVLNSGRT